MNNDLMVAQNGTGMQAMQNNSMAGEIIANGGVLQQNRNYQLRYQYKSRETKNKCFQLVRKKQCWLAKNFFTAGD